MVSVKSHDCSTHVLGRSSVLHQEVNHALRLDKQVAAQKEDAKHHSQGEDTEDSNLHHPSDEKAPLVGCQDQGAAIRRQHCAGPIAAGHEHSQALSPVGVSCLLQESLVENGSIHGLCVNPKSSGKVKGKLVVPLSTLNRPVLCSSKPPPAFPLSAPRMERELPQGCEQVGSQSVQPTDGWIPDPSWQSVSTSPQISKRRKREKEKGTWGRGWQPGITPCPLPSQPALKTVEWCCQIPGFLSREGELVSAGWELHKCKLQAKSLHRGKRKNSNSTPFQPPPRPAFLPLHVHPAAHPFPMMHTPSLPCHRCMHQLLCHSQVGADP